MSKREISRLIRWFLNNLQENGKPYILDYHQAAAVLDEHENTLLAARAGSGKTRTIVAKTAYLIAKKKLSEEEIIIFAFNRKARAEINERLSTVTYQNQPIFTSPAKNATTFHAFAYDIMGGKSIIKNRIITEEHQEREVKVLLKNHPHISVSTALQFINRAEQQYFSDYQKLHFKIQQNPDANIKKSLQILERTLTSYHQYLKKHQLYNFNLLMSGAIKKMANSKPSGLTNIKYLLVDEYQDFSLLFLNLIQSLRPHTNAAKLFVVGDDWQAINRFAGSEVKYFQNFQNYFQPDTKKLFLPTNYRSGKNIVRAANYFMGSAIADFQSCKSGNKKIKSQIYLHDVSRALFQYSHPINQSIYQFFSKEDPSPPELLLIYAKIIYQIIAKNPQSSLKILHRNNDLSFSGWSLEKFFQTITSFSLKQGITTSEQVTKNYSYSTIHRSKGLEADIVILLEIDAKKFPSLKPEEKNFQVFNETDQIIIEDQHRLFYVAMTRAKEQLHIISKTTKIDPKSKKLNFLSHLNPDHFNHLIY